MVAADWPLLLLLPPRSVLVAAAGTQPTTLVAAEGDRVYTVWDDRLVVLDANAASRHRSIGVGPALPAARGLAVRGGCVYVAGGLRD